MKHMVLLFLAAGVLFSCASLPKPVNESDSLVIGSIVWTFPDGFFQYPPRTHTDNIVLVIVDLSTGEQFKIKPENSFFTFLTNGSDKFVLQHVYLEKSIPGDNFNVMCQLNLPIKSSPKRIVNVGQIKIIFASPEISEAKQENGMIYGYWRFRQSYAITDNSEGVKKYLAEQDDDAVWSNHKVVNLYEK